MHLSATITLLLCYGQHHKSLFDSYKPFIHNHLQNPQSD
jgi:hypothetical protein